jgi:hypothetical protein
LIAAICACIAVRFYVVQRDRKANRWTLDMPVSALSLMFAAAAMIRLRPSPDVALLYGIRFGALSASIITIALSKVRGINGGHGGRTCVPITSLRERC